MAAPEPRLPSYRPLSLRRRLLIALLAVATAWAVFVVMTAKPGGANTKRADKPRCAASQSEGCVGGVSEVLVVPANPAAAPAASAARR